MFAAGQPASNSSIASSDELANEHGEVPERHVGEHAEPCREGGDDEHAIVLPQLKCSDWEPFLLVAMGELSDKRLTQDDVVRFLELSRRFQADRVRGMVEQTLAVRSFMFAPYKLIWLAREYQLAIGILRAGFTGMLRIPLYEIDDNVLDKIGWSAYRELTRVKEAIDIHRKIVATQPPIIKTHHSDCRNTELCDTHWRGAWWNGMGRMLMDGYANLTYEEAYERFVLLDFGEMGSSCKKAMLEKVKEGKAFGATRPLVDDAVKRLMDIFLHE
ncbi:hypothetical protein EIP86_004408 [Pleurotus ostreatoroseus]|nr:hypothetical protein EIP86_004408 [Pleurotus ostreatoroseus]